MDISRSNPYSPMRQELLYTRLTAQETEAQAYN